MATPYRRRRRGPWPETYRRRAFLPGCAPWPSRIDGMSIAATEPQSNSHQGQAEFSGTFHLSRTRSATMRAVFDLVPASVPRAFAQRLRTLTLLLGVILLGTGCGASARSDFDLNRGQSTGPNADEAEQVFAGGTTELGSDEEWRYRIQGGDQLEVVFFTHPEQNRFVKVRPDGFVSLPYLGDVRAEGKSPEELAGE